MKLFFHVFILTVCWEAVFGNPRPEDFPDAVTLNKGKTRAVFSASCGLMVGLSYDGNELLFRNLLPSEKTRREGEKKLRFYGGSRLWCHPAGGRTPYAGEVEKALGHNWPPDASLDHGTWALAGKGNDWIRLKSPASTKIGLRLEREFRIKENGVDIREKVIRERAGSIPAFVWSIMAVPYPEMILLDNDQPELSFEPLSATRNQYMDGAMAGICGSRPFHLIGRKGLWSAAIYPSHAVVQYHSNAMIPIVFGNTKKRYVELESRSVPIPLAEKETLEHSVRIRIFKRTDRGNPRTFVEMIRRNIGK